MMIQLQNAGLEATDPQKSYLLSGYQRLVLVMGSNFESYLPHILPHVFNLLKSVFVAQDGNYDKTQNFQTYDTEEATIAINMLSVIIDEMGVHFSPYIQESLKIIIPLCNHASNFEIRKSSVTCLSGLVKSSHAKDPQSACQLTREFIKLLWNSSDNEDFADIIKDQIIAMKDCIEVIDARFFVKEEIEELGNKIFNEMKKSDQRKKILEKAQKEDDLEEEEVEQLNEEN